MQILKICFFVATFGQISFLQLMLQQGIIQCRNPGFFEFLPLGIRVLDKLCVLVSEEMAAIGAMKIALPTLTNEDLWQKSGQ